MIRLSYTVQFDTPCILFKISFLPRCAVNRGPTGMKILGYLRGSQCKIFSKNKQEFTLEGKELIIPLIFFWKILFEMSILASKLNIIL